MRLDVYLYQHQMFHSREKARQAILAGAVAVNGAVAEKPSSSVSEQDRIEIIGEVNPYVGRGGFKLAAALESFGISLQGMHCLDVGASTGGFTDCMLQNGAADVVACDVGQNQLDPRIFADPRVQSLEKTDIRELARTPAVYGVMHRFDFISIDVSFISLTMVLPAVQHLLKPEGEGICLVKPQFETGAKKVGKKGVIRDPNVHRQVCMEIQQFAASLGFEIQGLIESPILGGDGNKEFLMWISRESSLLDTPIV